MFLEGGDQAVIVPGMQGIAQLAQCIAGLVVGRRPNSGHQNFGVMGGQGVLFACQQFLVKLFPGSKTGVLDGNILAGLQA